MTFSYNPKLKSLSSAPKSVSLLPALQEYYKKFSRQKEYDTRRKFDLHKDTRSVRNGEKKFTSHIHLLKSVASLFTICSSRLTSRLSSSLLLILKPLSRWPCALGLQSALNRLNLQPTLCQLSNFWLSPSEILLRLSKWWSLLLQWVHT